MSISNRIEQEEKPRNKREPRVFKELKETDYGMEFGVGNIQAGETPLLFQKGI